MDNTIIMSIIEIHKIKKNTKILMDTKNTVFEIIVTGPKSLSVLVRGGTFFIRPTKAKIREGTIKIGEPVTFKYRDSEGWRSFKTSKIISARISSMDDSWHYDI